MTELDLGKIPLRALKIIRKGYKKNRTDPLSRQRLQQINEIIETKERRYSFPKKVKLATR